MNKIDVVILWVDGNDKNWLKEKQKYLPETKSKENNNNARFRDWDNLQYLFRGIEKNASWVNNIFFITWGHLPSWLDISNPKLKVVKHSNYIPKEYLPTYNSSVIEMNLFRIEELSENFILFNDDIFITNKVEVEDFFKNDLPCDIYGETVMTSNKPNDVFAHKLFNNMSFVNKYFNKREVYKKNFFKYFNFKYGFKNVFRTIMLSPFNVFSYIDNTHLAQPLKKSTLAKLWELEPELMNTFAMKKFRNYDGFNQYLIRDFQLLSGEFVPRKNNLGKYFELTDDNKEIIDDLKKNKYKVVCLNDTINVKDFEKSKSTINKYLNELYPKKSSFEK